MTSKAQLDRSRGFTLVELMVVISIIALLLAILLPSLKSAREAGRAVSCASRMRGASLATNVYWMDNKSWFPVNSTYDVGNSGPGGATRNPYFAYRTTAPFVNQGQVSWLWQIRPYLNLNDMWNTPGFDPRKMSISQNPVLCPSTGYRVGMTNAQIDVVANLADGSHPSSYTISGYFGFGDPFLNDPRTTPGSTGSRYLPKRGEPRKPSILPLLGECVGGTYFGYLMPNYLITAYPYYHPNRTMNVFFADGHGKPFPFHVGNAPATQVDWYGPID